MSFASLRARLDPGDRTVAMKALGVALNTLGDGATLVWRRPQHQLVGMIKTISAFRDDQGRICRHISYALSLGAYTKQVEGIACRETDGHWSLEG